MKSKMNRRSFIKRSTVAAGALSIGFPHILSAREPSDILNCVIIGCGGRGSTHLEQVMLAKQNVAALVDPNEKAIASKMKTLEAKGIDTSKIKVFSDYRVMYDTMGKSLNAAFVAAPNHHHYGASLL